MRATPLDPAEFHVDPDVRRASCLPARAFLDPAFLQLELDTIFRSSWLLLPDRSAAEMRDDPRTLAELVARRGSRAPVALLDRPLFVQRDWKGRLHLFPNVCTHAWHVLVQGPERQRAITCPQHGRQFSDEGRFVHQPGFEDCPDFPTPDDHLRDLPVREWAGLLFGCLGEPARPFDETFAPVTESLARMPLDRLRRRPLAGEARELDGNWKQHAWNYMDRFHIPFIHKKPGGLADALDMATYRTELHGDAALQWAYARDPAHGFPPEWLPDRFRDPDGRRVFALWWLVFPNLALNFYPWGLSVNAYAPVPDKPRRTLFLWYHLVLDEETYARREEVWLNRDVDLEDVDAMTQVARGAASGFAPRGRFAAKEEEGPHWLHRKVVERTFGAARAPSPGKGA